MAELTTLRVSLTVSMTESGRFVPKATVVKQQGRRWSHVNLDIGSKDFEDESEALTFARDTVTGQLERRFSEAEIKFMDRGEDE